MSSIYQGDPALTIEKNGSTMRFIEGQPVTDKGYENAVLISLFSKKNWIGNVLFKDGSEKIGSDFEESNKLPVNLNGLNKRRDAAVKSLQWAIDDGIFNNVAVEVTNPNGSTILVRIRITPPSGEAVNLTLENFGANWRFQRNDPAHGRF